MEIILKLSALAILGATVVSLLRRTLPEMSVVASLATLGVLVTVAAGAVLHVMELISELSAFAGLSESLIKPIIKVLGISIVTKLAADLVKESGILSAATYIELVGGAVAISFATPLIFSLLGQITS